MDTGNGNVLIMSGSALTPVHGAQVTPSQSQGGDHATKVA